MGDKLSPPAAPRKNPKPSSTRASLTPAAVCDQTDCTRRRKAEMPGDLRPQCTHVDGSLRRGSGVRLTSRRGWVADAPVLAGAARAVLRCHQQAPGRHIHRLLDVRVAPGSVV